MPSFYIPSLYRNHPDATEKENTKSSTTKLMAEKQQHFVPPTTPATMDSSTNMMLSPPPVATGYKKTTIEYDFDDLASYWKSSGGGGGDDETAATQPSSTGTLDSEPFMTPIGRSSEASKRYQDDLSSLSPPPVPPIPVALISAKHRRKSSLVNHSDSERKVQRKLEKIKRRKAEQEQETETKTYEEQAEDDERIHRKRLDTMLKNPALFQNFQSRVRDMECLTEVGVRVVLHEFLSDMALVDLLDDICIEREPDDEELLAQQTPQETHLSSSVRKRLSLFASFGYGRLKSTSSTSSKAETTTMTQPPLHPKTTTTTALLSKDSNRQRAAMFRGSTGRRSTTGSRCSSTGYYPDTDDCTTAFSFDSIGLSLPSLEHTENSDHSDDMSSVGSVSCAWGGGMNGHREDSIRSLNFDDGLTPPSSVKSLFGEIPLEDDEYERT